MVTIDCPWCDDPVTIDDGDSLRCDGCRVEVDFAAAPAAAAEIGLAA